MSYRIENVGASFTDKTRQALESRLNILSKEGWKVDTVFSVEERSCLWQKYSTYYMILRRDDEPSSTGNEA